MKSLILFLFASIVICFYNSCSVSKEDKSEIEIVKTIKEGDFSESIARMEIQGMSCAHGCASFIEKKVAKLDGVSEASVDFDSNMATVKFDDSKITEKEIIQTIENLSDNKYSVTKVEIKKTVIKEVKEDKEQSSVPISSRNRLKEESIVKVSNTLNSFVFPKIFDLVSALLKAEK